MTDHWCQTGSAEVTLQQTRAWGYAAGWRPGVATYYGTVKGKYQEVASSMDWPILCHQEADSTYRIQLLRTPHKRLVVHFNRLKPCGDALESSLPTEDTSVSGEPVPKPPVTGSRLDELESEDISAQSEPHQPSPLVSPLPQSHPRQQLYPARNRQLLRDLVIWFLHESINNWYSMYSLKGELCNRAVLLLFLSSHDML